MTRYIHTPLGEGCMMYLPWQKWAGTEKDHDLTPWQTSLWWWWLCLYAIRVGFENLQYRTIGLVWFGWYCGSGFPCVETVQRALLSSLRKTIPAFNSGWIPLKSPLQHPSRCCSKTWLILHSCRNFWFCLQISSPTVQRLVLHVRRNVRGKWSPFSWYCPALETWRLKISVKMARCRRRREVNSRRFRKLWNGVRRLRIEDIFREISPSTRYDPVSEIRSLEDFNI